MSKICVMTSSYLIEGENNVELAKITRTDLFECSHLGKFYQLSSIHKKHISCAAQVGVCINVPFNGMKVGMPL